MHLLYNATIRSTLYYIMTEVIFLYNVITLLLRQVMKVEELKICLLEMELL